MALAIDRQPWRSPARFLNRPGTPARVRQSDTAEPPLQAECPRPVRIARRKLALGTGEPLPKGSEYLDLPCNRKACRVCGERLRFAYVGHFTAAFKKLPCLRFITLTVDPKTQLPGDDGEYRPITEAESRKWVLRAFQKLCKRLRHLGAVDYLASFETHKSGYWHLHVLASFNVTDKVLREHAFAVGFGAVLDVQALDGSERAIARRVGYVVKYMTKSAVECPGKRAYVASQGTGFHSAAAKLTRLAHSIGADAAARWTTEKAALLEARREQRAQLLAQASIIGADGGAVWSTDDADGQAARVVHYDVDSDTVELRTAQGVYMGRRARKTLRPHTPAALGFIFETSGRAGGFEGYDDTLTQEDIDRFDRADFSRCTQVYREHLVRDGKAIVVVHTYNADGYSFTEHTAADFMRDHPDELPTSMLDPDGEPEAEPDADR